MATPQDLFRDIYRSSRVQNAFNAWFIPAGVLEERLDENAIEQLLSICAVPKGSDSRIQENIKNGGIKTLCILVLIDAGKWISKFVAKCHHGLLDHKLPRNKEALEEIWGDSAETQSFCDLQWEFLAPKFDGRHQDYEREIILPFISHSLIDPKHRGLNSDIFEITIREGHLKSKLKSAEAHERRFGGKTVRCTRAIRKQLPKSQDSEREHDIHSQIDLWNHPNILRLYGSFTYEGQLNLILPAMDYRLSDLWVDDDEEAAIQYFPSEAAYFDAMSGLCSAIEKLHGFEQRSIGCHHDLKPDNILLKMKTFILADYGLTTLKQPLENSKTATSRFDAYLAPECIDTSGRPGEHKVGRDSDIYSLACIFTELLVFMVWGKAGVEEFREERVKASTLPIRGTAPFFDFRASKISKAVSERLQKIRSTNSEKKLLVNLIFKMLHWEPRRRPKAREVYAGIKEICEAVPRDPTDSALSLPISKKRMPTSALPYGQTQVRPKPSVLSKGEHLANKTSKESHKKGSLPFTDKTLVKEFDAIPFSLDEV